MGRPVGNKNKVEEVKVPVAVVEAPKPVETVNPNEAAHKKALMDGLDSDSKKRDAQAKEIVNLESQLKKLREDLDAQVVEFNVKKKMNENLGHSINSANMNLQMFDAKFKEMNAKRLEVLDKKIAEVEAADKELQALIKYNRETKKALDIQVGQFQTERESNRQLVHAANSALAQNNAMWKNREADIIRREKELEVAKEEFEAYQATIAPDLAKITSVRNENTELCKKLEMQRLEIERTRLEAVRQKEAAEDLKFTNGAKQAEATQRILNEEARLRKWEENLKDNALELAAKTTELNKELRRAKLTEIAKG